MLDHDFKPILFYTLGPIGNRFGWVFMVAEINDVWFLKWQSPLGDRGMSLFPNQDKLIATIEKMNDYRPDNF
jgi:hypothetical protein